MNGSNKLSAASTAWRRIENISLAAMRSSGLSGSSLLIPLLANAAQSQYLKKAISRYTFHWAR